MCYAPCKRFCFKPCKQTQTKNKLRESIRFSHKAYNLFYVVIEGEKQKQMQCSNKKKQGMNYKECKIKFLKIIQNRNMCISLLQLKMKIHDH